MKFLRYYYYKYFFFYDPTKSWVIHSFKVLAATAVASVLAWVEHQIMGVWILLPTLLFMIMIDAEQSYKKRFLAIIEMWAICFLFVVILMLTVKWEWLNLVTYLLLAFIGCYVANIRPTLLKTMVVALVFGLLELHFQLSITAIPLIGLNFGISLCLVLFFALVILPNHLSTQIKRSISVSLRNIARYYIFVLHDAAVGKHDVDNREFLQRQAIEQSHNLRTKVEFCQQNKLAFHQISSNLQQLLYSAINVEASITRLTTRAYFCGPLQQIDTCANTTRKVFLEALRGNFNQSSLLQQTYDELLVTIDAQNKIITNKAAFIQHDYQHWLNVANCINLFNQNYLLFVKAFQGVNNAN